MVNETFSGLAAWLALNRLGSSFFRSLRDAGQSPQALFAADAAALQALGFSAVACRRFDALREPGGTLRQQLAQDLDWLARQDAVQAISWDMPAYPPLLRQIPDPPPVLFVRGDAACLQRPQLALVGSRQATRAGLEDAFRFAQELAAHGLGVTSGLARGIDAAAHRGALAAGGITLAVMATGPDRTYPAGHAALAQAIVDGGGALLTEFPPGTEPRGGHFPRRNRLISGLSMGVLVVEAALPSGTLVTARLALEQGREVFAIPGSIHQPQSRGCHRLIRDGAALVETVGDILAELGGFRPQAAAAVPATASPVLEAPLQRLLACIGYHPTPVDVIVARSGCDPGTVLAQLTELELCGLVAPEAGGFSRIPQPAAG